MASMKMGLEMKMSQQLIMTPQLQQAIKLLQLSRVELQELIDQALIENPTLEELSDAEVREEEKEEEKKEDEGESENLIDEQEQLSYDEEWQHYVESGAGVIQESRSHEPDEDSNPLEATISRTESLADHLLWQLDISRLEEVEHEIAEYLIGNIDEDGYLSVSIRELLASTPGLQKLLTQALSDGLIDAPGWSKENNLFDERHDLRAKKEPVKGKRKRPEFEEDEEEELGEPMDVMDLVSNAHCAVVERVLKRVQNFDPPGVGARNLKECLLLQLRALKLEGSLEWRIIDQQMHLLEQKDLKRIARLQKAEIDEVVAAYQLITELEPKPGRPYGREVTQYVVPDVFIYKRGAEYVVSMNHESLPKLRINPYYQQLISEQKVKEAVQKKPASESEDMTYLYLQEKIKAGDWLMKSIEQRQKTIYRVAKSILKYQYEFFEKGIDYLKPLVLKDVAEDIEVHESTVSRITTNKYVYTPQGIFELKYFFTSGIDQGDGDVISSKKIKDYIKKLIDTEDKKRPLTDLQIKNMLKEAEQIKVARRTVAKYREAMNLLPSNKRKQLY
ncbi:MAG: RNA polymerase sigma-54 factor [Candidatus Lambdaproteobacteria bacterium RIFOXYD12_FULL_49_8]|uniref:RNA polymerase sigma-54 factor n=1 Tax=Candidatus Lambdaproteobacteria bacterium RIFOXYD2_FULL_50_16 TaxID=1817772 RepID=A0A1F6GGM3_9PROT|nr:MAG: RNA polymerase sigma-54 factor [Candidatus Lambdaproteobacteria bacterium RIFOXYD2_FULL_50_16]OGG98062.1 MAG: RNA polymerase sigma-54 factor [Candidatus Lambdaproteobacteria bacterium RIFOXYD12_FULL_49_8]